MKYLLLTELNNPTAETTNTQIPDITNNIEDASYPDSSGSCIIGTMTTESAIRNADKEMRRIARTADKMFVIANIVRSVFSNFFFIKASGEI